MLLLPPWCLHIFSSQMSLLATWVNWVTWDGPTVRWLVVCGAAATGQSLLGPVRNRVSLSTFLDLASEIEFLCSYIFWIHVWCFQSHSSNIPWFLYLFRSLLAFFEKKILRGRGPAFECGLILQHRSKIFNTKFERSCFDLQ